MDMNSLRLTIVERILDVGEKFNKKEKVWVEAPAMAPHIKVIWDMMANKTFGGLSEIETNAMRDLLTEAVGSLPDFAEKKYKVAKLPPYLMIMGGDVILMRRGSTPSMVTSKGQLHSSAEIILNKYQLATQEDVEEFLGLIPDSALLNTFFGLFEFDSDKLADALYQSTLEAEASRPVMVPLTADEQELLDICRASGMPADYIDVMFFMKGYDKSKLHIDMYIPSNLPPYVGMARDAVCSNSPSITSHPLPSEWSDPLSPLPLEEIERCLEDGVIYGALEKYPTSILLRILKEEQ